MLGYIFGGILSFCDLGPGRGIQPLKMFAPGERGAAAAPSIFLCGGGVSSHQLEALLQHTWRHNFTTACLCRKFHRSISELEKTKLFTLQAGDSIFGLCGQIDCCLFSSLRPAALLFARTRSSTPSICSIKSHVHGDISVKSNKQRNKDVFEMTGRRNMIFVMHS